MDYVIEVNQKCFRPDKKLLDPFRGIQAVIICDSLGKDSAMSPEIRPLTNEMVLFGTALTVESRPGDNLTVFKAIELSRPDDVLVIATHRHRSNAIWGDVASTVAKNYGITGMVTDGLVRDTAGILQVGLPVFAAGVVVNSCHFEGPGKIGFPVEVGGRVVKTGDLVVGDRDGVVVVSYECLEECGSKIPDLLTHEKKVFEEFASGVKITKELQKKLAGIAIRER